MSVVINIKNYGTFSNNCAPLLKISKKFLKLTNNILHQHKMLTKISLLQAVTACVRSLFKIVLAFVAHTFQVVGT